MGHLQAREDVCVQGFGGKRLHLEDLGIDGKVILKYLKGICWGRGGLDWCGSEQGQVVGCYVCRDKLWVP